MGSALIAVSRLLAPWMPGVNRIVNRVSRPRESLYTSLRTENGNARQMPPSATPQTGQPRPITPIVPSHLCPAPLRVLRVVETGVHADCSGRMVISGRMADVCAELERLAAREASSRPC